MSASAIATIAGTKAQNVPDIFKNPEFLVYLIITHEFLLGNFSSIDFIVLIRYYIFTI